MSKLLFLFLIGSLNFISATAQIKFSTKFFKVTEATVQSWSAGANRQSDKNQSGFIYQIKVTVTKANQSKFDSLIVDGNLLSVEIVKGSERNYTGSFSKGDQVIVLARTENSTPNKKASAKLSAAIAKKKEQGFLSYRIKGKPCLFPISKFTEASDQMKNQ